MDTRLTDGEISDADEANLETLLKGDNAFCAAMRKAIARRKERLPTERDYVLEDRE